MILTGGIDLPVGSITGLSSMVAGGVLFNGLGIGDGAIWFSAAVVILIGIIAEVLVGALNGVVITRFGVAPFIPDRSRRCRTGRRRASLCAGGRRVNIGFEFLRGATMGNPTFGAGIWHFATYVDRYATDGYGEPVTLLEAIDKAGAVGDLSYVDLNYPFTDPETTVAEVRSALDHNNLRTIGITPEIYNRTFVKGAFTNPDPGVRKLAHELVTEAVGIVRELGASYVKLWPGQDGWDYPFQVDHHALWKNSMDGVGLLAEQNPDIKFVIEYKPREPRVKMSFDSVSRTLLGIEKIGLPNIGILLDFGHALYGGESPADSAQLAIDYDRLFGMDVNDNMRGWDDDMVVGTVHPIELFEFFWTLRKNNWEGVWQLDQFPFREDSVQAAKDAISFLKRVDRGLDRLDTVALVEAQSRHDALAALRIAQQALYGDS